MPATVTLDWTERHGDNSTRIGVLVEGPTDRAGVLSALLAELPVAYDQFVLQKVGEFELIKGTSDIWRGDATYGAYRQKQELRAGQWEFNFQTSLETFRRTISRASLVYDADGVMDPQPPDARIIGWKPESRQAMGVDDTKPLTAFGWRVVVPVTTATLSWRKQIGELVGTVNASTFFGYTQQEVKLLPIQGRIRAEGEYELNLSFARKPTETDVNLGGVVVPIIYGWDIIDTPEIVFTEVDGRLVPKVERVKIHKGPLTGDFSLLAAILGL